MITSVVNCNDQCLIYLLSRKTCGLQYVGSTTDRFRLRWNNYKDNDRKVKPGKEQMQTELFEDFHSEKNLMGFYKIFVKCIIISV